MKEKSIFASVVSFFLILCGGPILLARAVAAVTANPADSSSGIKGVVKFEGTAPKPTHIDTSADPLCSKGRTAPATTEDIVVDSGGGLANVGVSVSGGLAHN